MTGLALEGGGTRGSYQAGAYIAFLECGIKIDGVCGTSIGALNGAIIASNKGAELPRIWRNSNIGSIFGFNKDFVEAIKASKINLKYLKSLILNLFAIIANKGIELQGVKDLIDKELNIDDLINSKIDYGLVTVRLKDLKPLYLWKQEMDKEKIKDYIIASCFLPIFKMEKLIDENYYLDGGFYDVGPVNMLLKKGYQKIYLIKIHGIGIHREYDRNADVTVIEPKRSLGSVLELDPKQIDENIKMGYYDTLKVLKNLDGYEYVFKPKKEKYYMKLNQNISKYEYRRISHFFHTQSKKETTLKAIEYVMKKESYNYYQIYQPKNIIKQIKKKKTDHFIYNYVKKLRVFF